MSVTYWTRNNQDIRYYDYLLERYNVVDLNMLFLIGYSAGLPHSHVSDHIWIPSTIQDKNGDELIVDKQMFDKAHRYLDDKWRIDLTKDGLSFDIWALRFLFDDLGFTTKKGGKIPMFMRSSDYDPVDLKDITSFTPPERLPGESVSDYERRYDADYRTWVAQTKNVNYTARYQLSEGFLYGLANAGYGTLPFTRIDTGWYTGDSNLIDLLQSALDTLHNPLYRGREDLQGRNLFYNWENSDPVPVIGTVGSVSPETEKGELGYGGYLAGEYEVTGYPDLYRYAYIQVDLGAIDVAITFFMYTGRLIPNVYVSTIVESGIEDWNFVGDYQVKTRVDFKRLPISVNLGDVSFSSQIRFPFHVTIDPYKQYTIPDHYLTADLGQMYTENSGQGTDKDGAFILADTCLMMDSSQLNDRPTPDSDLDANFQVTAPFKELGLTLEGQRAMYGLFAKGIQQVLFVRCVPDASFTHSQIENLSVEEINQMHFNSVVGQVLDTYNEYDHDRPNLVIRVSFDLHSSSGMFDMASLIVYARDMDDNTIPFAVLSVGDNRVISIDTTSCSEAVMTLKLKDL